MAEYLMSRGLIQESEHRKIKELYPKRDKYNLPQPKTITSEQLDRIIKAAKSNHHRYQGVINTALIILLSETGLRASEACELKLSDLHTPEGHQDPYIQVRMGKGGKSRKVPFTAKAQAAVRQYLKVRPQGSPFDNLFLGYAPQTGYQPLDRHAIARRIKAVSQKAGIPFVSHSLRHYRITEWSKYIPLPHVRVLAGHSSVTVTERYIHVSELEALRAAYNQGVI
jgi:integrase